MTTPPLTTSLDAPPHPVGAGVLLLDRIGPHELGRLALGFYFLFWGALLWLVELCASLTAVTLGLMPKLLLIAGSVALVTGAWRLHQVRSLDSSWHRRTREMVIITALLAYLCPFFVMWRRLPANIYLLCHVLALVALFNYLMALLCHTVGILGRAAGRRSLVIQAILFGTVAVVILFPALAMLTQAMILVARGGHDPFALFQFWMERTPPWAVLGLLLPFGLTLSLVWAAKDVVLNRLLATPNGN